MENYLDILENVTLFKNIPGNEIIRMLSSLDVTIKSYRKNDYIKEIGDLADFIGIVLNGNIQILKDDYYGNRNITASLGPASLFAESFASAGIKHLPVDIMSCNDSKIMFIARKEIFNMCGGGNCSYHHTLIENLLKIVASKNIMLTKKLEITSKKTTSEKLMAYLSDQARINNSSCFSIPFDRQALADYLGVERSAMSTEIGKLVKAGVIETKRNQFKLLNY